jgi:hypothetical protein
MKAEFNINDMIKVKLTERGLNIHKQYHLDLLGNLDISTVPEVDASGYSEFQMWEFMAIFGPHMYNGCKPICSMKILLNNVIPIKF